jgi:hypothetical protein
MNLLVRKTGLILGLALLLFACEESGEIALKLSPESGDFIISSIEIPVKASVGITEPYLIRDSIYNHSIIAVGKKTDDDFGSIEITGYSDLIFAGSKIKIKETAQYTKATISVVTQNFFGDGPIYDTQYLQIYELDEPQNKRSTSATSYNYKNQLLAELTMDTASLRTTNVFKADLLDEFALKIFNTARQDSIDYDDLREVVNGLAYVPHVDNNLLFQILTSSANSNINIKYTVDGKNDSLLLYFNRTPTYYVSTDYTGTELASLTNNNIASDNTTDLYLNSANGTFLELDFSALIDLRDSVGPMALNVAELLFEDVTLDTFYRINTNFLLNAFEKTPEFNYSDHSYFKTIVIVDGFQKYVDINLDSYRFSMNVIRDANDRSKGYFEVSSTEQNKYTPNGSRGPAFIDFIQSIVATNSQVTNPKYLIFTDSFGKSFQQIRFNKDKIRLKLYFSYLRDNI